MSDRHDADRRVRRTHAHLHGALASLVHEKAYGGIAVKEILARADVARSTFYAHYQDKDDLLERSMRDLLRRAARPSAPSISATDYILAFSLPFLEHVAECRCGDGVAPAAAMRGAALHDRLARVLAHHVAEELDVELRCRPRRAGAPPTDLLARHVASSFVATLSWWLEHPTHEAHEVEAHFCALVGPTLRAIFDE